MLALWLAGACGAQAQDAIAISEDTSKPLDERIQALQSEIATNDAAMAEIRSTMTGLRDKVRAHQRETLEFQGPVIEGDKDLLALQKEVEAKEKELTQLRQQLHQRLTTNPIIKERLANQQAMAKQYMDWETKLQERANRASDLNGALIGLEQQKKEAQAKETDEGTQKK
jgi:chromosome segregation ATPase